MTAAGALNVIRPFNSLALNFLANTSSIRVPQSSSINSRELLRQAWQPYQVSGKAWYTTAESICPFPQEYNHPLRPCCSEPTVPIGLRPQHCLLSGAESSGYGDTRHEQPKSAGYINLTWRWYLAKSIFSFYRFSSSWNVTLTLEI